MAESRKKIRVDPGKSLYFHMRNALPARMDEFYSRHSQALIPGNWNDLHRLRISAKRLRYSMELYQNCFESDFANTIESVKTIQDNLGKIQDCGMMIAFYEDILRQTSVDKDVKDQPEPSRDNPSEFIAAEIERLREVRDKRFADFLIFWNELNRRQFREKLLALIDKTFRMKADQTGDLNLMERIFIDSL